MLNFNTNIGTPIYLDDSNEPAFYIDATDVSFIEKANELYDEIKEYAKKSNTKLKLDKDGDPTNTMVFIESMKSDYDFILSKLDELLGEGVTKKVFKGRYSQTLLAKFMEFLKEAINKERMTHLEKYTSKKDNKDVL